MSRVHRDRFAFPVVASLAFDVQIPTKRGGDTLTLKQRFLMECTTQSRNQRAACMHDALASSVRTATALSTRRVSLWHISHSRFDSERMPLILPFRCRALDVPVVARNKRLPSDRG